MLSICLNKKNADKKTHWLAINQLIPFNKYQWQIKRFIEQNKFIHPINMHAFRQIIHCIMARNIAKN